MTSPKNLNIKVTPNELNFPLITHTVYSDAQFDSYGILNSEQGVEHFLDRLDIAMNDQVLREEDV
jgi:hypothetical protein